MEKKSRGIVNFKYPGIGFTGWMLSLMMVFCSLLLEGCVQKDILFPTEEPVEVVFDWREAPGASVDGMTVWFYGVDIPGNDWRFDLSGRDGGPVAIPSGTYDVLAVNSDLPKVNFSLTELFDRFTARARTYTTSDTLIYSTGMLYGATARRVGIDSDIVRLSRGGVSGPVDSSVRRIVLVPDSLSTVYDIRIDSVEYSSAIRSVTAILDGVAPSIEVGGRIHSDTGAGVVCRMSTDSLPMGILEGTACAFGSPEVECPRFILDVYVATSRKVSRRRFDVTSQVVCSPNPLHVFIRLSGLRFPQDDTGDPPADHDPDVGIDVDLDGWEVVEINYGE